MAAQTPKRPYRQRLRAESSAMTRQRIIDAARQVLTAQPLRGFNLSEVAEAARVVRSTIYTVFGSREGLLRAVAQDMTERGGWDRMREAFRDPDAWAAVRRNIEEGTRMAASEHPVALAISTLAAVDPDAAVVAAEMDELRLRGLRRRRPSGSDQMSTVTITYAPMSIEELLAVAKGAPVGLAQLARAPIQA